MPRRDSATLAIEVKRKKRKKSWVDANKKRSRRAKLRRRSDSE